MRTIGVDERIPFQPIILSSSPSCVPVLAPVRCPVAVCPALCSQTGPRTVVHSALMASHKRPREGGGGQKDMFASLLSKHTAQKRRRRDPNRKTMEEGARESGGSAMLKKLRDLRASRKLVTGAVNPPPKRPMLALCFLVVEDIPHAQVWKEWIEQSKAHANRGVRVFIHAKFPEKLPQEWQQYAIRDQKGDIINFKPNWGQIEITRALLKLFEIALRQHDDVDRLVYVSESCVPVTTFKVAAERLWEHDKSWLAAYQKPVDGYDGMMMNAVDTKAIPKECVYKCDTWVMLTRQHAKAVILDLPEHVGRPVWPFFSRVKVADEVCLPTLLACIGAIVSPEGDREDDQVLRRKVTYVDWTAGGPHPKAFPAFSADVVSTARKNNAVFARKFAPEACRIDDWCKLCDDLTLPKKERHQPEEDGSTPVAPSPASSLQCGDVLPPHDGERRNLVIVCAGDNSLHQEGNWYCDHRSFDLCIVYFGSDEGVAARFEKDSDYFIRREGPKWQLIRHTLTQTFWQRYEYIWLPDDDLSIDVPSINKFFSLAKSHGLNLCQPALVDLNVEHKILIQRPGNVLRFTNFVEIMAPCLRREALKHLFKTLDEDRIKSGWGLDLVWPHLLNYERVAVIDQTPMVHTRPLTAFNPNGFFYRKYNIDPMYEGQETLKMYGVRPFKPECRGRIPLPSISNR